MTVLESSPDDIVDVRLTEYLMAGYPDARQLFASLSCSYEYVRCLPLAGLAEDYSRNAELFEMVL